MSDADRIAALEARVAALEEVLSGGPRTVFMQDIVRWRLPKALPEMLKEYPTGVRTQHVMKRFGSSKATTALIMRRLADEGKIQWVRRRGDTYCIALPLGAPIPDGELTEKQMWVLKQMKARAIDGLFSASLFSFGRDIGVNPNSLHYIFGRLVARRKITLEKRGRLGNARVKTERAVYRIVESDAEVWASAFSQHPQRAPVNVDHVLGQTATSHGYDA